MTRFMEIFFQKDIDEVEIISSYSEHRNPWNEEMESTEINYTYFESF